MTTDPVQVLDPALADDLAKRLADPQTRDALLRIVELAPTLSLLLDMTDGFLRRGDVIADNVAAGIAELRASTSTSTIRDATQLARLLPEVAEATPTISSFLKSSVLRPEIVGVIGEFGEAAMEAKSTAYATKPRVGFTGAIRSLRDPDVQRGLGFVIEVARSIGRRVRAGD